MNENITITKLINRAGFSNTYERIRLERLIWLTVRELQPFIDDSKWNLVIEHLSVPDDFNQRKNQNYLTKTKLDQPEGYME